MKTAGARVHPPVAPMEDDKITPVETVETVETVELLNCRKRFWTK
jgi:hypothetical protein